MSLQCTKAIITAGGFGTRWLPLTKAIEKCMLPVGDRPVIDYVIEDCIKAGIRDVYILVGEQSEQMRRYYGDNDLLYKFLEEKGKTEELEALKRLGEGIAIHFVVQPWPTGTGGAVRDCIPHIDLQPGEQVLIVSGDQFVYNPSGESEAAKLMREVEATGQTVGMAVTNVPEEEVHKYGIVEIEQRGEHAYFKRIIEKPTREEAPTTLNNLCIYLFDKDLLDCVDRIQPAANGEYYLTEALNIYAQELGLELPVVVSDGEYMDIDTVPGWLRVNERMAQHAAHKA